MMPRKATSTRRRGRPSSRTTVRDDGQVILSRKRGRATKRISSRTQWELVWEDLDDFAPYFDASWALADVSEELLRHHARSIAAGLDPATGQPVRPLNPQGKAGQDARAGKRPDIRGIARTDGRDLASQLTRTKIKGRGNAKLGKGRVGTSATCSIKGGTGGHARYLEKALAEDGIEHLAVDGKAAEVIDKALDAWVDKALQGPPDTLPNFDRIQGRDLT